MPKQVVPITGLADIGVIKDTPSVSLPPNAFTDARNVRFKDNAVRKMEGEVNIFESLSGEDGWLNDADRGALQYLAWWPSPNQTTADRGYYIFVIENTTDTDNITHDVYAMLPGTEDNPTMIGSGFSPQGKWQHTLFNGGFTFIINNGVQRPQYVTEEATDSPDVTALRLNDLPGWDSYNVDETIISDTYNEANHGSEPTFETGISIQGSPTDYRVFRNGAHLNRVEDDGTINYNVAIGAQGEENDTIRFFAAALTDGDELEIRYQSTNPVIVRAAIVRAFGDFLVAGNLVEYNTLVNPGGANLPRVPDFNTVIRRMTGVVRTSNVAQPGSIPNDWNPFATGVSTADEFVIADTGIVQDMVPLQGNMYLYTNSSISVLRLTGNPNVPLTVQPVTDQYGALTTSAILEYDGRHFVIGSDDIYLFGGHPGSIQSIADQKIRRDFFTRVNPINNNLINLFTLRYAARDEIWICYPTIDSVAGELNEAYIWNYRNNTWTIRTLNSVVSGDIAPLPGGGTPSAIISFAGMSGTDDVVQVGSREVQTIQVLSTATVGHATAARPEVYNYQTLRTTPAPSNTDRPALDLDAPELIEVKIGNTFYSGPNPAMQEYNIINVPSIMAGNFASGGARFNIEYTRAEANTGNDNTQITVHANELTLPGTGDRMISGADYATALATHLDGLPEFDNWTITSSNRIINLRSDFAGMRELRGLSITTFTAMVEPITDTGPFTEVERMFTDTFGDELFTVLRLGEGPYTYSVSTNRNTGFAEADGITQLAFITDGNTFSAPDPFNRDSGVFEFPSMSGSYELRSMPPANFVNLVRETDRIPDSGVINSSTVTEDGVTIDRNEVEGGYTRTSTESTTPLNDTNEGVTVTVTNTTSTTQGTLFWRLFNSSDSVPGNNRGGDAAAAEARGAATQVRTMPMSSNQIRLVNLGPDQDRSDDTDGAYLYPYDGQRFSYGFVSGGFYYRFNTNRTDNQQDNFSANSFRVDDEALGTWSHTAGTGNITFFNANLRGSNSGQATAPTARAGGTLTSAQSTAIMNFQTQPVNNEAIGGPGIIYDNNVIILFNTFSDGNGRFTGRHQFGQTYITSSHSGNVTVNASRGMTDVTVEGRDFTVRNTNPFTINFTRQGVMAQSVPVNGTSTFEGADGSTDESWSWVNNPISLTGNSIGGSGTQDLRGANGRTETTQNGVTVVTQNTSSPMTTTQGTAPDMAVLLPSTNGGSVSNPLTASFNSTRDFYAVDWGGNNRAEWLSAYRLSDGSRVTGGGGGNVGSRNPPSGWTTGFESGAFPATPQFSATNITDPVALGAVSHSVMRGVQNCGSQGCECIALQSATATSNFGSNGIRQRGTGVFDGPAVGIQGRRGRNGFGWTTPSTGRSNECGGNLNNGVSFAGDLRVYTPIGSGSRATGIRIVLTGPNRTQTVTVDRVPSETYTVTNTNPFAVIVNAGGRSMQVNADSTATLTVSSEGNVWTVSTPTTTNYQFEVTNNNLRPLVSGSLIHDGETTDLAGLAPGESVSSSFSTLDIATATFVREVPQPGSMTVVTPADLMLVRSGIGTIPTDPAQLEPVKYDFRVDFTDSTTDIAISYETPENRDPNDPNNLNAEGAIEGWVRTLLRDDSFNRYFELHTNKVITEGSASSVQDNEVGIDTLRIEARAAPGNDFTLDGQTITMPPHNAVDISTPVDQENGGDSAISINSIQRGINTVNDPITISVATGTQVPQADGSFMDVFISRHGITLNGMFPATVAGDQAITEVVRDHLRLDSSFDTRWQVDGTDPDNLTITSDNDGPHYIETEQVSPASSGVLPGHIAFTSTQQGVTAPVDMDVTYPSILLVPPVGETANEQNIMLNPLPGDTSTDRLTNVDITNIIRERFDTASGWTVISNNDNNIGPSVSATQIRIVRNEEGVVNSGADQSQGWRVMGISYGNTGATLPGERDAANDGTVIGRLNTTDFVRADAGGPISDMNPFNHLDEVGRGDNVDFRGSRTERSQPTRIMIQVTNPNVTSMDPVINPDGSLMTTDGNEPELDGSNIAFQEGNTQYIAANFGGRGDYDPTDQSGSQPGERRTADQIVTSLQSRIGTTNRRVQVSRNGLELTIIPTQFSEIANFVVDVFINDSMRNVALWNAIVMANGETQPDLAARAIDPSHNNGIQSTVPTNVDEGSDEQFNASPQRIPNFSDRNILEGNAFDLVMNTSNINSTFDPLRPWPTSQVNLNREYPIFASVDIEEGGTITDQSFRGADLGFLYIDQPYESYVERVELALTPEFDTEQLTALALWADGGTPEMLGGRISQALLDVKTYGSNNPGQTEGEFNNERAGARLLLNQFDIGEDYKIDMRIHGRFINLRISDVNSDNAVTWVLSGIQADVMKGGTR